jgi:predicted enzyme related to lactoylglutathione lyase
MSEGIKTILYPVTDLAAAKALYGGLAGAEPIADAEYYVGWRIDGQDIGLVPNGHQTGMTGPTPFWHVEDIKASLQSLLDGGAEQLQEVRNVGGGKLTATVKDADGNVIGLVQNP